MKKLISVLLAVVMMFSCVVPVFADMGGPTVFQYDVIVINPDGIRSDTGDYIPYQAKATVMYEYKLQNDEIEYNLKYNEEYVTAKNSDISKVLPEIGIDKAFRLPNEIGKVVLKPEGVEMRTGPGVSFDVVTVIPYGTELKSSYASSETNIGWMFVTYNNYSGWVYVFRGERDCADIISDKYMGRIEILDEGHYIFDNFEDRNKLIEVPAGTKLSFRYKLNDFTYFVQYNNVKGWIYSTEGSENSDNSFDIVIYTDDALYTTKESVLYEAPLKDASSLKKLSSVPKGKLVRLLKKTIHRTEKEYINWYYTEYNGSFGWIKKSDNDKENIVINCMQKIKPKKDIKIYSAPSSSASKAGTVPKGKNITVAGFPNSDGFMLYNNGGKPGWIHADSSYELIEYFTETDSFKASEFIPLNCLNTSTDNPLADTIDSFPEAPFIIEPIVDISTDSQPTSVNSSKKSTGIVAGCVLAACFLSMSAVIIVLILNKKKKQNP